MTVEEQINIRIKEENLDTGKISDGYHTFLDLYKHRMALFVALSNTLQRLDEKQITWKSKLHSDGTMFEGDWFIAGIYHAPGKQITYHLPLTYWDKLKCPELKNAPEFDGHTPDDVIERLLNGF